MSMKALLWSIAQQDLTPAEKLTLIILADRYNVDSNECWPSKSRIAKDTGLSEATLKRTINSLIDKGLISREERADSKGRKISNVYTFHIPKDEREKLTIIRQTAYHEPSEGLTISPLEPSNNNQLIEPNKPSDKRKEFWETALGVMGALNVPEAPARGILGLALNKCNNAFLPESDLAFIHTQDATQIFLRKSRQSTGRF